MCGSIYLLPLNFMCDLVHTHAHLSLQLNLLKRSVRPREDDPLGRLLVVGEWEEIHLLHTPPLFSIMQASLYNTLYLLLKLQPIYWSLDY